MTRPEKRIDGRPRHVLARAMPEVQTVGLDQQMGAGSREMDPRSTVERPGVAFPHLADAFVLTVQARRE